MLDTMPQHLTSRQHAWLYVMMKANGVKESAAADRQSRCGIAVSEDRHAVRWRLADARVQRATFALTGYPHLSMPPRGDAQERPDPEAIRRWWSMHRADVKSLRKLKRQAK